MTAPECEQVPGNLAILQPHYSAASHMIGTMNAFTYDTSLTTQLYASSGWHTFNSNKDFDGQLQAPSCLTTTGMSGQLTEFKMIKYNYHTRTSRSFSGMKPNFNACNTHEGTGMCICKFTCQPGTYQDQTGQTTCKTCPNGFYQNENARLRCKSCGAGKYLNSQGKIASTFCKDCVAGQYSQIELTAACTRCPGGKFSGRLNVAKYPFVLTIGFSPGANAKTVTATPTPELPDAIPSSVSVARIVCPELVTTSNWLPTGLSNPAPSSLNEYRISVSGLEVTATRIDDTISGWDDVDLKFLCHTDDHCEGLCPASTWSASPGLINANQCTACPGGKSSQPGAATEIQCEGCPIGKLKVFVSHVL